MRKVLIFDLEKRLQIRSAWDTPRQPPEILSKVPAELSRNGGPQTVWGASDLARLPRYPGKGCQYPQSYFWFLEGLEWSSPRNSHGIFLSPGREVSKNRKIIKIGASIAEIQPIQNHRFPRISKKSRSKIEISRRFELFNLGGHESIARV